MAFSATFTGTGRDCTLISGSSTIVVSSATGLLVGANVQGTGIPVGAKIRVIVGTTVTLSANATASGTQSLIFSSVYGSTLTVALSASSDIATPQAILNAGFGEPLTGTVEPMIHFVGALTVKWADIVSGAVFDFASWGLYFGVGGRWQFDGASIFGELRGGYLVNGEQFFKTAGPTFYARNFNNNVPGGSSMFSGVTVGAMTGKFRMHSLRFVEIAGNNSGPVFLNHRMESIIDNMILDYSGDTNGANALVGAAYGVLNNTTIMKANSGITATNGTNYATFNGIYYVGLYTQAPAARFNLINNTTIDKYAPQVLSTQTIGGSVRYANEGYSNIDLSSPGWGLEDLKVKYLRYNGNNILTFTRLVDLSFKNSLGVALTDVTLYIKSGPTTLINAVQAGNYSVNTTGLVLTWNTYVTTYRTADVIADTILQVAQIRKYGFIEQSAEYSINFDTYSQPFFLLSDGYVSGISEAAAAAITTAGINWTAKTVTPTTDLNLDQINARFAWELAQTTGSAYTDPRVLSGNTLTLGAGWLLVISAGRTLSAGTELNTITIPSISLGGLIDAGVTVVGLVTQATPTNLTGITITGNLTYNTNTPITVVLDTCTVSGTVSNSGTGLVTITLANASTIGLAGANVTTQRFSYVTAPSIATGSRVQLYDVTNGVELYNDVLAAPLNYQHTYLADITVRLRATYQAGVDAKLPLESISVLTASNLQFLAAQSTDGIYVANGIDGATCAEFGADYVNVQIDVSSGTTTSVQRAYAWATYVETTTDGIRNFMNAVLAIDEVNYLIDQAIVDMKFDNPGVTPVKIEGGVITRKNGTTVIADTSGSIQIDPAKVYLANSAAISIDLKTIKNYTAASV